MPVIGGLDKYLRRLAQSGVLPPSLPLPPAPGYSWLSPEARRPWVDATLAHLSAGDGHRPTHRTREAAGNIALDSPLSSLPGVGPGLAYKLGRLGVHTVWDALYFFPHRHVDYSSRVPLAQLRMHDEQTVVVSVWQAEEKLLGGRPSTVAKVVDESGSLRVVWFNQPYLARRLLPNTRLALSGGVDLFQGYPVMNNPEYELLPRERPARPEPGMGAGPETDIEETLHTGRLVPIYPLTEGLSSRTVRRVMKQVVDAWTPRLDDFLPPAIRQRQSFLALGRAIRQAHFPDTQEAAQAARRRLAFDEFFLLQLGVLSRRARWQRDETAPELALDRATLEACLRSLPFSLTHAQQRALDEILADMVQARPMARLLQGDVGSGKTVVATLALLVTALRGYQGAFMVPTELLAEQHHRSVSALLKGMRLPRKVEVGLLTGSLKPGDKENIRSGLAEGRLNLVIGTHALVQQDV
ncbi:MAG: DEAD/DEAH box helicase, partial [Chloroflexota bacterium]